MQKQFQNKPISQLSLDHEHITNQLECRNNRLKDLRLHTALLISFFGRKIFKYMGLIIGFIIFISNTSVLKIINSNINEPALLVVIGVVFSVVWIMTSHDT